MKIQVNIYGQKFEIEIKARDVDNKNFSSKATAVVASWLECRLWDSSHRHEAFPDFCQEIIDCAIELHKFVEV